MSLTQATRRSSKMSLTQSTKWSCIISLIQSRKWSLDNGHIIFNWQRRQSGQLIVSLTQATCTLRRDNILGFLYCTILYMYIVIVHASIIFWILHVQGINVWFAAVSAKNALDWKDVWPKLRYKILQQIIWTAKCLYRYKHRVLLFHFAQCSREDENVRPGKGG